MPQKYPLIFSLASAVNTDLFVARVVTKGRILMSFDEGEWWCHGVEPGGMTARGDDPIMAFAAFKQALQEIYEDFAEGCDSDAFVSQVMQFSHQVHQTAAVDWERARMEFRAGKEVDAPFDQLPKLEQPVEITTHVTIQTKVTRSEPVADVTWPEDTVKLASKAA